MNNYKNTRRAHRAAPRNPETNRAHEGCAVCIESVRRTPGGAWVHDRTGEVMGPGGGPQKPRPAHLFIGWDGSHLWRFGKRIELSDTTAGDAWYLHHWQWQVTTTPSRRQFAFGVTGWGLRMDGGMSSSGGEYVIRRHSQLVLLIGRRKVNVDHYWRDRKEERAWAARRQQRIEAPNESVSTTA